MVLAAFKAAVRALRGLRRWVRLPLASAIVFFLPGDYYSGFLPWSCNPFDCNCGEQHYDGIDGQAVARQDET